MDGASLLGRQGEEADSGEAPNRDHVLSGHPETGVEDPKVGHELSGYLLAASTDRAA